MSTASRSMVLSRRASAIENLGTMGLGDGELSIEDAERMGIYRVNSIHIIGIATATEVGLSPDKYPIRVLLTNRVGNKVDTVIRYWVVQTASKHMIPFSRKPLASEVPIKNLYALVPDLDEILWDAWSEVQDNEGVLDFVPEMVANQDALYAYLNLIDPTDEQRADAYTRFKDILEAYAAAGNVAAFKIGENAFLRGRPHGTDFPASKGRNASSIALHEALLTIALNQHALVKRHPNVQAGVVTLGAYTIASMFRTGMYESFEATEYHTVICDPVDSEKTKFRINHFVQAKGTVMPAGYEPGKEIDLTGFKVSKKMNELANLCVYLSGLMHYMYNHTTGGSYVLGPLLSMMSMYEMISSATPKEEQHDITSVMYEALHPVNKRAIANIHFKKSGVWTHGRVRSSPTMEKFQMDAFASVRSNPYPAGAHKGYICLLALKRVNEAGLSPFLPWASSLNACIDVAEEIVKSGAKGHIGAMYYTGESASMSSSSLDQYLPDLACFIQTFNARDSLAFSPHLSPEVAGRAGMNWANLLKGLKSADVSATSTDLVKRYLSTQGMVTFDFNPEDETTWGPSSNAAKVARQRISQIFD